MGLRGCLGRWIEGNRSEIRMLFSQHIYTLTIVIPFNFIYSDHSVERATLRTQHPYLRKREAFTPPHSYIEKESDSSVISSFQIMGIVNILSLQQIQYLRNSEKGPLSLKIFAFDIVTSCLHCCNVPSSLQDFAAALILGEFGRVWSRQ
jgi:hypothetical protein